MKSKSRFTQILLYAVGLSVLSLGVFFMPAANMKLGNLFFGEVPLLYNTAIAQFFYTQAAYPFMRAPEPYAYYQLSRTYFIEGNLEHALTLAEKELLYYPDETRTYYIQGLTLAYLHREEEAIQAFGKFLEYTPDSWAARNDKAWLHFRIGDLDGGLEAIRPAALGSPDNPWVMNTYGVLLMNKGNLQEAKEALEAAAEAASNLTPEGWGNAYPGNSPEMYPVGLASMQATIAANVSKIEEKLENE